MRKFCLWLGLPVLALLFGVSSAAFGDQIFLKERPEGNEGIVLEETDEYIVIRFPRQEIKLIRRGDVPARIEGSPGVRLPPSRPEGEKAGPSIAAPRAEVPPGFGAVAGRVLYRGQPVERALVKIIHLVESTSLAEMVRKSVEGTDFETVTGRDGFYRFEKVPVGRYLLRWLPLGSDSWIRRLSDQTYDFEVKEGKTHRERDIETSRPVLD
jgi:hypothetical protein